MAAAASATPVQAIKVGVRRKRRAVSCPSIQRTLHRNEQTVHVQKKKRIKTIDKTTAAALNRAPTENALSAVDLALKSVSMQAVFAHKFLNLCNKFESRVNKMLDRMDSSVRTVKRRADAAHVAKKSIVRVVGQLEDAKNLHPHELCLVGTVVPSAPPPLIHHLLEKPSYCYAQLTAY